MLKKLWKSLFGEHFKLGGANVHVTKDHISITGFNAHIRFNKNSKMGNIKVGSAIVTWNCITSRLVINNEAIEII